MSKESQISINPLKRPRDPSPSEISPPPETTHKWKAKYHYENSRNNSNTNNHHYCWYCDKLLKSEYETLENSKFFNEHLKPLIPFTDAKTIEIIKSTRIEKECNKKLNNTFNLIPAAIWNSPSDCWRINKYMILKKSDITNNFPDTSKLVYEFINSIKLEHKNKKSPITGDVTESDLKNSSKFAPQLTQLISEILQNYTGIDNEEMKKYKIVELKLLSTPIDQPIPQAPHMDSDDSKSISVIINLNHSTWSTFMNLFPHRDAESNKFFGSPTYPQRYWENFINFEIKQSEMIIFQPTAIHMGPGNKLESTIDEKENSTIRWVLFASFNQIKDDKLNKVTPKQVWEFLDSNKSLIQIKSIINRQRMRFTQKHLELIAESQIEKAKTEITE